MEEMVPFSAREFEIEVVFKGDNNQWQPEDVEEFHSAIIAAIPDFVNKRVDLEVIQPKPPTNVHKMVWAICHDGLQALKICLVPKPDSGKTAVAAPFAIIGEFGKGKEHRLSLHKYGPEDAEDEEDVGATMTHAMVIEFASMSMQVVESSPTKLDAIGGRRPHLIEREPA